MNYSPSHWYQYQHGSYPSRKNDNVEYVDKLTADQIFPYDGKKPFNTIPLSSTSIISGDSSNSHSSRGRINNGMYERNKEGTVDTTIHSDFLTSTYFHGSNEASVNNANKCSNLSKFNHPRMSKDRSNHPYIFRGSCSGLQELDNLDRGEVKGMTINNNKSIFSLKGAYQSKIDKMVPTIPSPSWNTNTILSHSDDRFNSASNHFLSHQGRSPISNRTSFTMSENPNDMINTSVWYIVQFKLGRKQIFYTTNRNIFWGMKVGTMVKVSNITFMLACSKSMNIKILFP